MRRKVYILLSILLLTLAMGFTVYADEFTISQTKATVNIGDTVDLDISGTDKVPHFASYNVNIAKVDQNGIVTAVRKGKTTISARIGLTYKKCTVTVVDSSIKLNKTSATIYTGGTSTKTVQLKATVRGASKAVQWESLNPAVATVDEKGKVTSVSSGTAVITATANGKTASCPVTVKGSSIALNMDSMQLSTKGNGSSMKLTPSITGSSKSVKWTTSDKTIATVSGGRVTGRNTGTAIITATANGVSATCEVNVIKGSVSINEEKVLLYTGETRQLKTNAGKKDVVTWSSSDDTVITVDEKGKVTAVGAGTAVISATLNDTTDTCKITVKNTITEIEENTVSLKTKGTDKTYTLHYNIIGRSSSVKWTSSDSKVVSISRGKLTAKGAGTAIITAKANGVTDTMEVKVSVYDPTIKLNQPEYTLYTKKGNTYTLKASVDGPVKKAVWESSNPEVATVVNGKVTAVGEGQTVITASANGVAAECLITVKESKVILGTENITLDKGETAQLPADVVGYSQTLKYATTNSKVATVKNGTIIGKNYGEADIKVTANGVISVCHVKVAACEHVYDEGVVTKEATCTELGIRTFTCTLCGDTYTEDIPLKDHEYTDSSVTEPTCTERGYTTHTCSKCGDSYVDTYVNALGHDWGEWITTKEPTETETGKKKHICSRCEEEETEDIPVVVHEHQYSSVVTEPTCTEQGYTTHTCSECGHSYADTYVDALGHDYEWVTTKEATCTEDGLKEYKCTRCGDVSETETIDAGHAWSEWTVTKEPASGVHTTVSDFGTQKRSCSICGQTEEESIINIDLGNGEIKTLYGSFWDDEAYKTLGMVNELRTSLGLNELKWFNGFEDLGKIRATEISYSYSHTRPNGDKATYYYIYEDVPYGLGENIGVGDTSAEKIFNGWKGSSGHYANMTDESYKSYLCACFKERYSRVSGEDAYWYCWVQLFAEFDLTGTDDTCKHDYTDTVTEPTCTEKGYTTHTCTKCGDTYVDTYIDALGHNYEWVTTKEATCTEDGLKEYKCTHCEDVSETETIDAGHAWSEWTVTKEPASGAHTTVSDFGTQKRTCSLCGQTEEESIINIDLGNGETETLYGTFRDDEAYKTLDMVNELRTSLGLNELKWFDDFEDLGKIRSAEISYSFSHTRPNGDKATYYYIYEDVPYGLGENAHLGAVYASTAFNAWKGSSGHYANMTDESYKSYYCACFKARKYNDFYEEYTYGNCWVQLFAEFDLTSTDDTCKHDYTDVVTEPTCTEKGYTTHTCTKCGDSYVDTYTDALGHEYTDAVTEPTCTEQGYTTHICTKCGDSYVDTYTDALGHEYTDTVTEPTCTEQGYTTHTCTKCGDSYKDIYTEASGEHDEGEWVTTEEPDVGVAGLKELQCTKCGYVLDTEEIPMLTTDGTDSVYYFENSDGSQEMTVGHYNEDEAQEMFELVNNYREENGLDTFTMPTTYMSTYTDLRAVETSYLWDHTRPSGAGCEYAENIAMGPPDARGNTPSVQEIFDAWVASSGHKENLDAVRTKNWTCISVFYKKCSVYNSEGEVSCCAYEAYWVETFK